MARRSVLLVVSTVLLAVLTTSFAPAAEGVLDLIPEGALGFGIVNRVAQTDAKIVALGKQLQIPAESLLNMLRAKTGLQAGLDEQGSVAVVLMPGDNVEPIQLLLVQVTDFGKLIAQLGPDDATAAIVRVKVLGSPFLVGSRGGFAVFTEPRHRPTLEKILDAPKRAPEDVAEMSKWLGESDVAVVVQRPAIALLTGLGQAKLQEAKAMFGALPAQPGFGDAEVETIAAAFGFYEQVLKVIGEEVQTYAAAARVDDAGNVHLEDWTVMTPGGTADQALKQVKPPQGDLLAGLPSGPFVVAGAGALPEGLAKALIDFSVGIMKAAPGLYGLDAKQTAKMAEISRQAMKGIRGMGMVMGVGKPGDSLFSGMAVVMKVDDSDAYLADYRKVLGVMNEVVKDSESWVFSAAEVEQIQVGKVSALKITMKAPAGRQVKALPGYEEMMKALFGPDGTITAYVAAADRQTIVASYSGEKLLRQCIRAVRRPQRGLSGREELAATAALLPDGCQWIGYFSPKGTIDFGNRFVRAFAPEEAVGPPPFPATPPIGFAAKTTPGGVRGYAVVPAQVIQAIGKYVNEIRRMVISPRGKAQPEPIAEELF